MVVVQLELSAYGTNVGCKTHKVALNRKKIEQESAIDVKRKKEKTLKDKEFLKP